VSIDDALRAPTIEAAYSRRQEHRIRAIAPGKIANFTVLDDDPYAVETIKLKDIGVWAIRSNAGRRQLDSATLLTAERRPLIRRERRFDRPGEGEH